jgi:nitrogen-specific signal transduction histidine kinase/ActR/RegA family two-component response regulator
MLVVNTDLTEQKRWEARFLRSQRMESLGTLASGIAHDLNNVLAPILMAVHFLEDSVQDESSRTMLSTLEKSALRGADIIKQVLTFARGIEGERCILDVRFLIKDMAKIIEETFPKSIVARVNCPASLWPVQADATQLNQVLMNLCINARDSMGDGGQLSILAENVQLDEYYSRMSPEAKPGPYVVITVSDTGPGIPAGIMDKIFDPFFTTKEVGKGTGLGLSTALGIVKSHDGFIHVFSESGKGAHFKVFLPAQVGAEPLAPLDEKARPLRGTNELIMIVEDEEAIRQITKKTLEIHGYRVLSACDGTEALALYVQNSDDIKLVFTDMLMPYMDGLATIRALRKIEPKLKIIATSGMITYKGELEAAGIEVLDFLPKPFTADQLLRMLRDALPAVDLVNDSHSL